MKKFILPLILLGLLFIFTAISAMNPGIWRQTVLFAGFVFGIAAMIMRISVVLKNQ